MTNQIECKYADQPHTVWYWVEDPHDPVPMPYVLHFDNQADAVNWAEETVDLAHVSLRWMKVFRTDNEVYQCWRWENPEPLPVLDAVQAAVRVTEAGRRTSLQLLWVALLVFLACTYLVIKR